MLLQIDTFDKLDGRKLMDLYCEGNEENVEYFYPDMSDKNAALQKVENDFLEFLKTRFFCDRRNRYMILEINGIWVSALRLNYIEDGLYYIEALETHPEYRKYGFAAKLLSEVLDLMKQQGRYKICSCVGHNNIPSLKTHQKCGFSIVSDVGYDYLQKKTDDECYGMQLSYE